MKTYDTSTLELMERGETVGIMAASRLTGLAVAEISRMIKTRRLSTKAIPGKAKPEVVVGDLIDLIKWKNQKANIGKIRKLRKATASTGAKSTTTTQDRVVVGIFEEAMSRKPDCVAVPESADTIGDLITVAEAAAKVTKDNSLALEIQTWVAWMETL
jgi:hypothetical protein